MSLLHEVVMGDCSQVYHYLLNKLRYIEKNPQDRNQLDEIKNDLTNEDNSLQITICSLNNPRIQNLYFKLLSHLR